MENPRIRVGIIGAGRMGITHYSILNAHPDVEVAAVVDTTPVVNSMIEKYLDVRTYKSYAALFDRENLDAVFLCTPPALNYEILLAAHRKGIHAFIEKPGTLSAAQATEAAALYETDGLVNQVGYVNRFNDVFTTVKRLLEQDVVGAVLRFRSEMYARTVIREESGSSWRSTREQGGGAVYEMASHAIDLVNYFFGRPHAVVGTCLSKVYSKRVEDIASTSLLYEGGTVGSLYVNWSDPSYRKPTNKFEVFGKRGRLVADQHGLKVHLSESNARCGFREGWNSRSITDVFSSVPFFVRGTEFTAQLYHFIDCVKAGDASKCRCTFRDAADALYVIEHMFRDSLDTVKAVKK
jgi:predicted dehydrogenase